MKRFGNFLLLIGVGAMAGAVSGAQIFYESFEDPVISGTVATTPTGWTSTTTDKTGMGNNAVIGKTGNQYAHIDDYPGSGTHNGALTTTASILNSNLLAHIHYTLTCDITQSAGTGYEGTMEFLAGSTVLKSVSKTVPVANDFTAAQLKIDFMAQPGHANLGEQLAIRLRNTAGSWQEKVYFDNVALEAIHTSVDTSAPSPDPMTWVHKPATAGGLGMLMTCSVATDTNWVEYMFTNTVNGHNSGWIGGTTWHDTGLEHGVEYVYMAKARDRSFNYNETAWSVPATNTADQLILFYDSFERPVVSSAASTTDPYGWVDKSTGASLQCGLGNLTSTTYSNFKGNQAAWFNVYNTVPILQTTTNILDLELEPGGIYTLTFNGAETSNTGSYVLYADLLAGTNVVMTASTAPGSTAQNFGLHTASNTVTTSEATPGAREPLAIRLRVTGGAWNQQSYIDNLTLIGILPPPAGTVIIVK